MEAGIEIEERGNSGRRSGGNFRDSLWLAGMDVRRSWVSFPVAALTVLVPGFYLVVLYSAVFSGSGGVFDTFLLDLWFLLMVAVLNVNFLFNRDYYYKLSEDNYTKRLSFLRGLPISSRAVIVGRAMYMAVALVCSVPPFFLIPCLASAELRALIGPLNYIWFVEVWLGYALFMMGFLLFMWNGLSFQTEQLLLFLFFPGGCLLVATVSNLALDGGLTMSLIQVAKTQGPLAALVSIAAGCAALTLWVKMAEKRLDRRELG